jgi:hypothetical protein
MNPPRSEEVDAALDLQRLRVELSGVVDERAEVVVGLAAAAYRRASDEGRGDARLPDGGRAVRGRGALHGRPCQGDLRIRAVNLDDSDGLAGSVVQVNVEDSPFLVTTAVTEELRGWATR